MGRTFPYEKNSSRIIHKQEQITRWIKDQKYYQEDEGQINTYNAISHQETYLTVNLYNSADPTVPDGNNYYIYQVEFKD